MWCPPSMESFAVRKPTARVFSVVREVVSRTGFGLIEEQVGDTTVTVLAFISRTRVRNLFCDLLGRQIRTEVFLTRKAQGQKRVEA